MRTVPVMISGNQRNRRNIPRFAGVAAVCALLAGAMEYWPSTSVIAWRTYEEAITESRSSGKSIYVDLYAEWCIPCKRMDDVTFTNDTVQALLRERFIPVRIDVDTDAFSDSLRGAWKLRGIPTGILLDTHGQELRRTVGFQTSTELIGWLDPTTVTSVLHWKSFPEARGEGRASGKSLVTLVTMIPDSKRALSVLLSDSSFTRFLGERFVPSTIAGYDSTAAWIDSLRAQTPLEYPFSGVLFVVHSPDLQVLGQIVVSQAEVDDPAIIQQKLSAFLPMP